MNGWPYANMVNLGGGLDIPHTVHGLTNDWPATTPVDDEASPETTVTPEDLIRTVQPLLPGGSTLILEPGRSLVATAGEVVNCSGKLRCYNGNYILSFI